jgi:thioredoxin 1
MIEAPGYTLVKFGAPWCAPCKNLEGYLGDVADKAQVNLVKINVDEDPRAAAMHGIRSLPTLVLVKDGEVIDRTTQWTRPSLEAWLKKSINPHV